jgi:hypothetical protein
LWPLSTLSAAFPCPITADGWKKNSIPACKAP